MSYRLNHTQRWQLAVTLLLLYYPVMLYIDLPVYAVGGKIPFAMVAHESVTVVIITVEFFLWLTASEWILNKLFTRWGESFLLEFRLLPQLLTFGIAIALAFAFIVASGNVLTFFDSVVHDVFGVHFLVTNPSQTTPAFWDLYRRTNIGFIVLIMLSGFYLIANRRAGLRVREAQLRSERLEKENTAAQLAALRNQVNPHFLFNSLSILASLVRDNAELSAQFVNELSKFYRYTLDQAKADQVDLGTELAFIRSYLFLLNLRFEGKLQVAFNLSDQHLTNYKIAPLTLQLLIENAVKHNQMSREKPLLIDVAVVGNELVVTNNVQLRPRDTGTTGIGLQNIIERYRLLTDRAIAIHESAEKFRVALPLLS